MLVAGTAQGAGGPTRTPSPPRLQEVALACRSSTRRRHAPPATGAAVLQSEPTALTGPGGVVGLTWDGTAARAPARAELRQHTAAGWGAWTPVEVEASEEDGRGGTEPFVVTGADQVQGRLTGTASALPTGVRLLVVDPGTLARRRAGRRAGRRQATQARSFSATAVDAPAITSRAAWGADESLRTGSPSYAIVRAAVVHHTAGSNTYTADRGPAVLRGIYAFHTSGRGWSDIGYNVLADRYGRLWEGRYGGVSKGVVGAHVAGYNTGSFGVSVMGTFETAAPPAATQEAVAQVLAWKLSLYGRLRHLDHLARGPDRPGRRRPPRPRPDRVPRAGVLRPARRHPHPRPRDPGATAGRDAPRRPAPRAHARPRGPVPADADRPRPGRRRHPRRAEPHGSGRVSVSARVPRPGAAPPSRSARAGRPSTSSSGSPDLTGDAKNDLLTRSSATGQLAVYAGDGKGGFIGRARPRPRVGPGPARARPRRHHRRRPRGRRRGRPPTA